jgi:hypothetical protein
VRSTGFRDNRKKLVFISSGLPRNILKGLIRGFNFQSSFMTPMDSNQHANNTNLALAHLGIRAIGVFIRKIGVNERRRK